jgi:ribonuclease P/MRP protein subunit RPP40
MWFLASPRDPCSALMFLVYISDLTLQLRSRHALFADDCKIYGTADKANEIKSDLAVVQTWCDVWKMKLNVEKCSVLYIGVSNSKTNYTIAGKILVTVQQQKDLGVVLTSTLSWSEHVATTVCRANFVVHTLKKSFQRVNEESFVKLYSSYVRPILEYANLIWAPVLKRDIDLLEKVQQRATKIVHGLQNKQYEERLNILQLQTVVNRRKRGDLIWTFKLLKNIKVSCRIDGMFSLKDNDGLRGHSLKLHHEKYKTRIRQNFLPNRVFDNWNALPECAVTSDSISKFKNQIDDVYFSRNAQMSKQ